jgi:2-methylfumaryl-CoA hydratase
MTGDDPRRSTPAGADLPPRTIGGPWFEDFHRGLAFEAPGVTVTDAHAAWHQALFGDRLRLPLDHHASKAVTGAATALVHPLLAINIAIGQSTWASQRVKANLFYRGLALQRPVHVGDTLRTRTEVVALRQNRGQAGRPATGIVALEMTTANQRGETVLHCWRCPMIPCRDPAAQTGHADDLDAVGRGITTPSLAASSLPSGWRLEATREWQGLRAADLLPGQRCLVEARDTLTLAPELVRSTLNMAMAHTDARLSYLGERLVYGGHTIAMCFAQITRALPNLITLSAWESCDHVGPVLEGDRLRTEFTVTGIAPVARASGGGSLLRIEADAYASRGTPERESRVLDWRFWAWSL